MKEFLAVLAVLLSGVVGEAPAPYPASGWRPSGPAFELPQATQRPLKQEYLPSPPLDPRVPAVGPTSLPGEDVSVQGLPSQQEQQQIFQISPVNGQQYAGPSFNADLQNLDQNFRQSQFQLQQQRAREFERQRQIDAQLARRQSTPQTPRQFVQKTTITPGTDESRTTQFESTTEAINLNEGEILEDDNRPAVPAKQRGQVSVEVTKQNIQEYPPEVFFSPLTQLRNQQQLVPLDQFAQYRAQAYYQPNQDVSQKQVAQGYDGPAHLSALTSILAQRQLTEQPQQYTQGYVQGPVIFIAGGQDEAAKLIAPESQYQPAISQFQPVPEQQQYQPQQVLIQPQSFNQQPNVPVNQNEPIQPQFVYQQAYQPQYQTQPQLQFEQNQQNVFLPQNQDLNQYYLSQQQIFSQNQAAQDSLQSGLDINQQGNDIDEQRQDEDEGNRGSTASAVATAFGTRTQPRIPNNQYGGPASYPRSQGYPSAQTTTEANDREEVTESTPAIAQANAFARGDSRKNAKLRSRRIRPVFTLDRSGHLVLAQEQQS